VSFSGADYDVIVVGAGLAGLRATAILQQAGREVVCLEASDRVGGRVTSDDVDDFIIDRGFQLINKGYPELRAAIDVEELELRRAPRAVALKGDASQTIGMSSLGVLLASPRRWPGSTADGVRMAAWLARVTFGPIASIEKSKDLSMTEGLAALHLSEPLRREILDPFLRGIFLDPELSGSWNLAQLIIRSLARGGPSLAARGARQLSEVLRARCEPDSIRCRTTATSVSPHEVTTESGRLTAQAVVLACDPSATSKILEVPSVLMNRQATYWWAFAGEPRTAALVLDSRTPQLTSTLAVSGIQPRYAPQNMTLVAAATLATPSGENEALTRSAVARTHERAVNEMQLVAVSDIPAALPSQLPPLALRRNPRVAGVYVAGDWFESASIQGALVSGRRAAQAILADDARRN